MAEHQTSRPPDYNVSALDKLTERRGQIGVAWKNDNGTVSIKLNYSTVIDTRDQDLVITLFPVDRRPTKRREKAAVSADLDSGSDIPF